MLQKDDLFWSAMSNARFVKERRVSESEKQGFPT